MIYAILPLENDPILRIKPLGQSLGKDDGITFRRVSKSRVSVAIFVDRPWSDISTLSHTVAVMMMIIGNDMS